MHSGQGARPPRYWNRARRAAARPSRAAARAPGARRRSLRRSAPRGRRGEPFVALSSDLCRTVPPKHHGRARASRPNAGPGRAEGSGMAKARTAEAARAGPGLAPADALPRRPRPRRGDARRRLGLGRFAPTRAAFGPRGQRRATPSRSCGAPRSSSPTPSRSGAGRCPTAFAAATATSDVSLLLAGDRHALRRRRHGLGVVLLPGDRRRRLRPCLHGRARDAAQGGARPRARALRRAALGGASSARARAARRGLARDGRRRGATSGGRCRRGWRCRPTA